jgi:preprotein translocase subunit SecE
MDGTDMAKAGAAAKPNVFARIARYFGDVRAEMRRVVWPTRPDVVNSSVVVIVTLLFFTVFTFAIDQAIIQIIRLIAKIGG